MKTKDREENVDSRLDASLRNSEKQQVKRVLGEFEELFSDTIGQTRIAHHKIYICPPNRRRARRMPHAFRYESKKQIDDMLDKGIIRRSTRPQS